MLRFLQINFVFLPEILQVTDLLIFYPQIQEKTENSRQKRVLIHLPNKISYLYEKNP